MVAFGEPLIRHAAGDVGNYPQAVIFPTNPKNATNLRRLRATFSTGEKAFCAATLAGNGTIHQKATGQPQGLLQWVAKIICG